MSPRLDPRRVLFLWLITLSSAFADVKPSPLFQDHAVLQRDKPVPVWGTADAGERVTVSFAGQTRTATAAGDGRWSVTLDPLPANATSATLTITGKNTVTLDDIVVGEVWLASGQSNMEWVVSNTHDADIERRLARFPLIREIKVKKTAADAPAATFEGEWRVSSPDTVGGFSAVAYAFARDVHFALDVPVGIVNSTWGGTPIESWLSPAALDANPAFAVVRERWSKVMAEYPAKKAAYDIELAAWSAAKAAAEARGEKFPQVSPRGPTGLGSPNNPGVLHNGMIAPLLPYALRGAIWYQGESNAGRASEYDELFAAMIQGWRSDFAQGDFPFFWVQLAAYKSGRADANEWAFLREAQTKTLALPATGQAVVLDSGVSDFGDIHPRDKAPVGRRLARLAFARVYGETGVAESGPVYAAIESVAAAPEAQPARPAALRVTFNGGTGKLRQPTPKVGGFEIAGEDKVFQPADARIENGAVIVSSPAVPAPVAVRYGWRNFPDAWLQDDLGLPVAPFRSDTW